MAANLTDHLSIAGLRQAYAGGCAPANVISEVMARIAAYERRGVWIYVLGQSEIDEQLRMLEVARAAGRKLPLYGVPFAVKDNIDMAGVPTTAACPEFAYVPKGSATAVRRLMEAGAIVVGKTNLDQFATGLVGTRSPYGVCQNAYDAEWISGGSSSGSAVAVAGGLVSFSLGTDTAGSGRVPAAFNNIVGLKPTRGLISAAGVVPACRSLDCVSIFAGTCGEAELILEIARGTDAFDPLSRVGPKMMAENGKAGLRVGIPDHLEFFGNRDAAALFSKSCGCIEKLGAEIVTIDFSPFRQAGDLLYNGPWVAERLTAAGKLLRENPEALRPELRTILQDAEKYSAKDAFEGLHQLAILRQKAEAQWARMDVLLAPTTGTIYKIAEVDTDPLRLNRNLGLYTTFVNLLDLCALAVPAGFLSNGLPWGVTWMAPAFHEARLLQLGAAFEKQISLEEGAR